MIERRVGAYCPVCRTFEYTDFLGEAFVAQHTHPLRRYWYNMKNNRNLGSWLKEYRAEVERFKALSAEEQAKLTWVNDEIDR
jgi:hypothetical protein